MPPVIVAKDLYKCYAGFAPVLRGVNIDVNAGEMVAIMGPSGCGKSTMLHILGMLHAPDSGSLQILDTNVLTFNREQTAAFRRGNMGFVMQSSNLFDHSTVFENVEFPLIYEGIPPQERWERVIRALELVRLSARVHYRSNRLSGGEQQRAAIARAMVNNPRILLADEPTGALDSRTSGLIMENFRTLCHTGGLCMVMVTHDPKMAEFCDTIYTLEEGLLQCRQRNPVPPAEEGGQNLLSGPVPVVRGALTAERFPEPSGRCLMEDAHRMHAAGLLSRIYALDDNTSLAAPGGYALPLAVRRVGGWRFLSVLSALFKHVRGSSHTLWWLWRALPMRERWGKTMCSHFWAFGCGALLARWALEEKIECIYAAGGHAPATAAWVAARLLGIPFAIAVTTRDLAKPGLDWAVKASHAAFVRCDTEATRQALRKLLPEFPDERLLLLRDPLTLTPPEEDPEAADAVCHEGRALELLAVGTIEARKGYDILLHACAALQAEGLDFQLKIVGLGPERFRLRRLSRKLALHRRVDFVGRVPHENMPDFYAKADIFVAPGRKTRKGDMDGLPSALTEAMAFGVPVVVSDLPGQVEAVEDEQSGLVTAQEDAVALTCALKRLIMQPDERRRMGAEGKRRIRLLLDEERAESRLSALFKAACGKR